MKFLSIISLMLTTLCLFGCANGNVQKNESSGTESTPEESTITTTQTTEDTTTETATVPEETHKLASQIPENETTFNISDYQDSIDFFEKNDINVTVGEIHNYDDAVEQAKAVWRDKMEFDTYEGRDIKIYYDAESDCWLAVLATNWEYFHEQMDKGIYWMSCDPCVIIRSDGKVLACWTE